MGISTVLAKETQAPALTAIALLQKNGMEPPDVAMHVVRRYLQQRGTNG